MPASDGALRSRSFRLLMAVSFLGFGGYGLLLPVVPLWAVAGGSGEFGAGATTGTFMLATVVTQFVVPELLRRLEHRWVLALGMVLLGAPSPILALSTELSMLLGVSLVRGIGFGLATVAGNALVAELVPASQRGRASARYGVAAGTAMLLLLPSGVPMAERFGFGPSFSLAAVLGAAGAALALGVRISRAGQSRTAHEPALAVPTALSDWRAVRGSAVPMLAMLTCSMAQGGLVTFLPLALPGPAAVVAAALLATTACALLGRVIAGELSDRFGLAGRLLPMGIGLTGTGMVGAALSVLGPASPALLAVVGAALVGLGFGIVQNDALVVMFTAAGAAGFGAASAAWNIGYDAGTGVGALVLGAVAQPLSFAAAFAVCAAVLAAVLPAALLSSRRASSSKASGHSPGDSYHPQ